MHVRCPPLARVIVSIPTDPWRGSSCPSLLTPGEGHRVHPYRPLARVMVSIPTDLTDFSSLHRAL